MTQKALFLFEHTGLAAMPFTAAGWETYAVDLLNEGNNSFVSHYIKTDILAEEAQLADLACECMFVFGMPPCTDLTVAGARHFAGKKRKNPQFQNEAVHLVRATERIGERAEIDWWVENPIGVIPSFWRKYDYIISPHEYGGYLPENDKHPLWPKYITPRDAYTKQTCIWVKPGIKLPPKKHVRPEHLGYAVNRQTAFLGGKSQKTKTIRSASPRGFFTALAEFYGNLL